MIGMILALFRILQLGDFMFHNHMKVYEKNEEVLYLFVDYTFEFAQLGNKEEKEKNIYERVLDYIKSKKITLNGKKVFLVLNGVVISLLLLNHPINTTIIKTGANPNYQYVEYDENFTTPIVEGEHVITVKPNEQITVTIPKEETKVETPTVSAPTVTNKVTTPQAPATTSPSIAPNTPITTTEPAAPSAPTTTAPVQEPAPIVETQPAAKMVTVYRSNGTVEQIVLEDYVVGVVGAEMPASFNIEALKAQSLLARTYALKKINAGQTLTDHESTQAYKDVNQLKTLWGSSFDTYYNKIKDAVSSTQGESITYNGTLIEAVYHSTSNGKTENAVDVWGNAFPYLMSVDSHWDLSASSYLREKDMSIAVVNSLLGIDVSGANTQVVSKTEGDNIKTFQINDKTYDGVYLRNLLGLRSTDFDMVFKDGTITFVTRGYGHGVGMSQYGANGMAKEGFTYKEIIQHYYPGTIIKTK